MESDQKPSAMLLRLNQNKRGDGKVFYHGKIGDVVFIGTVSDDGTVKVYPRGTDQSYLTKLRPHEEGGWRGRIGRLDISARLIVESNEAATPWIRVTLIT